MTLHPPGTEGRALGEQRLGEALVLTLPATTNHPNDDSPPLTRWTGEAHPVPVMTNRGCPAVVGPAGSGGPVQPD